MTSSSKTVDFEHPTQVLFTTLPVVLFVFIKHGNFEMFGSPPAVRGDSAESCLSQTTADAGHILASVKC